MARPNLRIIAGRPVPVLHEEFHRTTTEHDWLVVACKAIFLSIACATVLWAFAALVLSLSVPR